MPLSIFEFAERSKLAFEFLHAVLAKHAQPRRVGFLDPLRIHGFAHGHQRDRIRIAAHPCSGPGDALANGIDIVGNRHFEEL